MLLRDTISINMAASVPDEKSDTTKFLEAAKEFSFEQKLSVVQSILCKIPREQRQPWNASQIAHQLREKEKFKSLVAEQRAEDDSEIHNGVETLESGSDTVLTQNIPEQPKPQAPPLIDPYEQSMRYYEKHLVLNHFQVKYIKLNKR